MGILKKVHETALYRRFVDSFRDYFASSQTKEELRRKHELFFNLTSYFFFRNGPRNKHKNHTVMDKLNFYKSHIRPGESVVDVGCFDGYYTQQLREYGCNVAGVDSLGSVVKRAVKLDPDGEYYHAFAEDLPFTDDSFDVGLYSHILHHVLNPEDIVSEAERVIKPDGRIIITVPTRLRLEPNHLRYFSRAELEELVKDYFPNLEYYERVGTGHGCVASKYPLQRKG